MIEYEKRAMIEAEDKYTFRQSTQISMQTGLIGHLRADMDTDGNGFFSSWFDFREELKTDEFKAEFDDVINSLREEGDILHNRRALAKYCYCTPQSRMQEEPGYYGVRVDTEKYAYLLRLNPDRGEYNLYCYCYRRDWLDQHLKDAEKGIRFIDSHYKELFRIPDGGKVKIHYSWNEDQIRTCRYIDDYHVEIGSNLYHICEFAERMEYGGHTCEPVRDNLPERCYSIPSQLARENKKFVYGLVREGARAKDYETAILWLSDCGLVHKISRVNAGGIPLKAYEDLKAFKLFLVDVGLLGCMAGLRQRTLLDGNDLFIEFKGALTEQYVCQQLKTIEDLGVYYYTNDRGFCEIDFIVNTGEQVIPVEVKAETNLRAKSLKTYQEKFTPEIAVRTSMADFKKEDRLVNLPLYAVEQIAEL